MKLLLNICAHDGIASHYCGVGTIVRKYIAAAVKFCRENDIAYKMNLFTPECDEHSFGYNRALENHHKALANVDLYKVSNGSGGATNFGTVGNWITLSKNTAALLNVLMTDGYDKIITLLHDTPYCGVLDTIKQSEDHIIVWIPHSTAKNHGESADLKRSRDEWKKRLQYEIRAVGHINETDNMYFGVISRFFGEHLLAEYDLKAEKQKYIINGELSEPEPEYDGSPSCEVLFEKIKNSEQIVLSFGRAEKYKNFEAAMLLAAEMKLRGVVIVQSFYEDRPIIREYKALAEKTDTALFVNAPFAFPQYVLRRFSGKIILLVPSEKEPMGLIINEVRKLNKENILIVSNDRDGLREQIRDGVNGLLVDLDNIKASAEKIGQYLNADCMRRLNDASQETLKTEYDFYRNFQVFMDGLLKSVPDSGAGSLPQ